MPMLLTDEEKERLQQLENKHKVRCDALEDTHLDESIEASLVSAPVLSPFLPTSAAGICSFLEFADVSAQDIILDLGCGDGRVLIGAALIRGCSGIGVDVSATCIAGAIGMSFMEGVAADTEWLVADASVAGALSEELLARATLVYLYCYPTLLAAIKPLAQQLCTRGARVVTMQYHFDDDWVCSAQREAPSLRLYTSVNTSDGA